MSTPAPARSADFHKTAEVVERARLAQAQVELAIEDLKLHALASAGSSIRNAIRLRPADAQIQALFRRIENEWRRSQELKQNWREAYLSAKIAVQAGELQGAHAALTRLEQLDPETAPSFAQYLDAQELAYAVRGQMAAIRLGARVTPGQPPVQTADLPPNSRGLSALAAATSATGAFGSSAGDETAWGGLDGTAACAAWEFCEDVLNRLGDERDPVKRSSIVQQALQRDPTEPLFVREAELGALETQMRTAGTKQGWALRRGAAAPVLSRSSEEPETPGQKVAWAPVVRGVIAAGLIAALGTFVYQRTQQRPVPSAPVQRADVKSGVAAGVALPVQVISHVPVAVLLDFVPVRSTANGEFYSVKVPGGMHVLSVAHEDAMLHLLSNADGRVKPEIRDAGLAALIVNRGRLTMSNASPRYVALDGRKVTREVAGEGVAVSPGQHRLIVDHQLFTFKEAGGAPVILVALSGSPTKDERSQVKTAPASGAAISARVHKVLASLPVKPVAASSKGSQVVSPPEVEMMSSGNALPVPDQALNVLPPATQGPALAPVVRQERSAVEAAETNQIVGVLHTYASAWGAKDTARILALRPDLTKRSVKSDLDGVKSIAMNIRPLGAPQITGDHAVVQCAYQVSQTFADGVQKRSPEVRVNYHLVRRGGGWVISGTR